jgi:uncharacterized protein (TIGR02996 family)
MTSDGFLDAIRDEPEDRSTRLIYADWLDEHDQPIQAEFIRVQLRLEQLSPDDPQRAELAAREHELRIAHSGDLLGIPPKSLRQVEFRGGLVERLEFAPDTSAEVIAPLLRRHPVQQLTIADLPTLAGLVEAGPEVLGLVRGLHITGHPTNRRNCQFRRLLDRLFTSPHLRRLNQLTLVGHVVTNYLTQVLVQCPALETLRRLELRQTRLADAGLMQLLRPGHFPRLHSWQVECPSASVLGLRGLFTPQRVPHWRCLHWPALRSCDPSDLDGLAACRALHTLHLSLPWRQRDTRPLFGWLDKLKGLHDLHLGGTVDREALEELAGRTGLAQIRNLHIQCPWSLSYFHQSIRDLFTRSPHFLPAARLHLN